MGSKKGKGNRGAMYARVSSAGQRDRHTIASQLTNIPRVMAEHGIDLVFPPETFVDDGRSAATGHLEDRPGLQDILARAAAGELDVVGVVGIDRLSRSEDMIERTFVLGTLQRAGVRILETDSGHMHDLGDSLGQQNVQNKSLGAAEENIKRRDASMRGMRDAIAAGRKAHGVTPYGYDHDRWKGWAISATEGPIVDESYTRAAGGESCYAIAYDLNERRIPTLRPRPDGKPRKNQAAFWSAGRVLKIIRSSMYRGEWVARKKAHIVVKTPALVSDAIWYRANDALSVNARVGLRQTRSIYLCEAITRCALCERRVGILSAFKNAKVERPAYYCCLSKRDVQLREGGGCALRNRTVAEVDERVWIRLYEALTTQYDELQELYAKRNRAARQQASAWERDIETARGVLDRVTRTESGIVERYQKGRLSEEAFDAALDKSGRERAFAKLQLEEAQRARAVGSRGERQQRLDLKDLQRAAKLAKPAQRQTIVRSMVPGYDDYFVTLDQAEIRIKGAVWETTATEVLASSSSGRRSRQYFKAPPLVIMELVA